MQHLHHPPILAVTALVLGPALVGGFLHDRTPYFRGHQTALFAGWDVFAGAEPWLPDDPATRPGQHPRLYAVGSPDVYVDRSGNLCFHSPNGYGQTFQLDNTLTPPARGFKEVVLQIAYRGDIDLGSIALEYWVDVESNYVLPHEVVMLHEDGRRRELLLRFETGHLRSMDDSLHVVRPIDDFSVWFRFEGHDGCIDALLLDCRSELGDDTVTACDVPTSNSRLDPTQGWIRAWIDATGSQRLSADTLFLMAQGLPFDRFGYFLASKTTGHAVHPGGSQGDLCLAGDIGRFAQDGASSGRAGSIQIEVDLGAIPTHPPSGVMVGETWYFQAWYRDVNPTPTSNFTDVVGLTFR